jgi:hypothetical protein
MDTFAPFGFFPHTMGLVLPALFLVTGDTLVFFAWVVFAFDRVVLFTEEPAFFPFVTAFAIERLHHFGSLCGTSRKKRASVSNIACLS